MLHKEDAEMFKILHERPFFFAEPLGAVEWQMKEWCLGSGTMAEGRYMMEDGTKERRRW